MQDEEARGIDWAIKMRKGLAIFLFALSALAMMSCAVGESPQTGNQDFIIFKGEAVDPLNEYRIKDTENRLLPSSIEHSGKIPIAGDQGQTGSCTSWAVGYYLKTYQEVVEEGWDKDEHLFSPMYLFAMQCRHYSQPYSFIAAWDALRQYGCAKWPSMPYEDYQLASDLQIEKNTYADIIIPESVHAEARRYRCGEMYQLCNLNQIKMALTSTPVLIAINHYSTPPRNPSPEDNFITYAPCEKAPHVVICTG